MVYDIVYIVVGKVCESGDIIIEDILLFDVKLDDLLVVRIIGVYYYFMVFYYNRLIILLVIFVKDG